MEVGQVQAFQELGVSAEAVLGLLFCSAYHALACRQPLGEAGWILLVWPRAQLVAETLLLHVALASPQVPCVAARAQASSVRLVVAVVWVPPQAVPHVSAVLDFALAAASAFHPVPVAQLHSCSLLLP